MIHLQKASKSNRAVFWVGVIGLCVSVGVVWALNMRDAVFAAQDAVKTQFSEINGVTTDLQAATRDMRANFQAKAPEAAHADPLAAQAKTPVIIPDAVVEQLKTQLIKTE